MTLTGTKVLSPHRYTLNQYIRIANDLIRINDTKPEPWVALGRYCEMKMNRERAIIFADKV
jgi:hypothetical protein